MLSWRQLTAHWDPISVPIHAAHPPLLTAGQWWSRQLRDCLCWGATVTRSEPRITANDYLGNLCLLEGNAMFSIGQSGEHLRGGIEGAWVALLDNREDVVRSPA